MPGRVPQLYNPRTVVDASPAAAAETIIATFTGINTIDADSLVLLLAQANFTVGTSGTAARLRLRRTSVTGTVVGDTGAITGGIAATNLITQDIIGVDNPGAVASFVYVLTLQITAGAAVSTVSSVVIAPIVA
jgi:hypothetical protein